MIDSQLLFDKFDKDHLQAIASALTLLHQSGILTDQVASNSSRVTEGFQERTPKELVEEIMQVQQTNRHLLALHEWAGNFQKELDNA